MISKKEIFEQYQLVDVCIVSSTLLVFCAIHTPAKDYDLDVSQILYCDNGNWSKGPCFNIEAVSICNSQRSPSVVYVLGREGECFLVSTSGHEDISIISDNYPSGPYREVQVVGNYIFVLGEERSVFTRNLEDRTPNWKKIDIGLPSENEFIDKSDSFENEDTLIHELINNSEVMFSLAGNNINDVCMVGSSGEIWFWDGIKWNTGNSPTNLNLYSVVNVSDKYIACGQFGTLLIGHRNQWKIIDLDITESNFCSVASFSEKIFLADGFSLFVYNSDGFSKVDLLDNAEIPSHRVKSNNEVIVSVAAKEIFTSHNAIDWKSLLL